MGQIHTPIPPSVGINEDYKIGGYPVYTHVLVCVCRNRDIYTGIWYCLEINISIIHIKIHEKGGVSIIGVMYNVLYMYIFTSAVPVYVHTNAYMCVHICVYVCMYTYLRGGVSSM